MNIRRSLAARITLLALVSGALALAGVILVIGTFTSAPTNLKALLIVGVIILLPALLGWLAVRLIVRPLRRFDQAIASLKAADYKTKLQAPEFSEFAGVFTGLNELTARLRYEEELRKDLISDTSHELNTPLAAMNSQLIAMQEGALPITNERIGLLKEQVDRLTNLVQGLDAYTRSRLPQDAPSQDIAVAKVCHRLLKELAPQLKKIEVKVDVAPGFTIKGNPTALKQMLLNLLQNTVRYAKASKISIVADENGLIYSDNGKGVPAKSLPHLFERFYRVEPSRNRATGGLGLGLAITKELVERQGWTIRAEDAAPGLRFIITFRSQSHSVHMV